MPNKSKFKILLVCTGNTCRSPMAEGIINKLISEKKIDSIEVNSAGTGTIDGSPATDYAIEVAKHWDIDIAGHRSTVLTANLIRQADLILAMGHEHVQRIISSDKSARDKTHLLKGFPNPCNPTQERVEDPIGGSLEQYNQTFLELDEELRKIFPRIIEISSGKG